MASRPVPAAAVGKSSAVPAAGSLADLTSDLLALIGAGGELVQANRAWADLLPWAGSDLSVDRFREHVHPDDLLALEQGRRMLLHGEDLERLVLRVEARPGEWREIEWSGIGDFGGGTIAVRGRDVTEQRRLERDHELRAHRLERTNADLQEFAYVASHDLSEPLRMVTSYLDLVRRRYDDKLDETGREFIHYAVDGAQRMRALIDDLLRFSRAGAADGRSTTMEPVDLDAVAAAVRHDLAGAIAEAGAELVVGPLGTVRGDVTQLGQLLQNLVANAVKFRTADRAPVVEIGATRVGGELVLEVHDNGIGIDPRHAERIFQVFTRLHPRDEYEGTGIGLSICRRICERHGGRIEVCSVPGAGTTFVVTLPDA